MKLDGKNIISDDDVYLTGKNVGYTLSQKLEEQTDAINKLASNVKWLYKYGGTGSGGGGGTVSTEFDIYATIGGQQINGLQITLSDTGLYKLVIKINKPLQRNFNVSYSFGNTTVKNIKLTIDNNYTYETDLNLTSNDTIVIEATDGEITKSKLAFILTKAYSLDFKLVDSNGIEYDQDYIFKNDADTKEVYTEIKYTINVSGIFTYKITVDGTTYEEGTLYDSSSEEYNTLVGSIRVKLDQLKELGTHEVNSVVNIVTTSTLLAGKTFNIETVTSSLTARLFSSMGTIYSSELTENYSKFTPGSIKFSVQVLNGINENRTFSINCKFDDGEWIFKDNIAVKERAVYSFNLYFAKDANELHSITVLVNNNTSFTFYFYVDNTLKDLLYYDLGDNEGQFLINEYDSLWYRYGIDILKLDLYKNKIHLELRNSTAPIYIENTSPETSQSFNFALGFLYSNYNLSEKTILELHNNNGPLIILKLDSLTIGSNKKDIYIPKSKILSSESDYHLLNIVGNCIKSSSNEVLYRYSFYIDGVLEALFELVYNYKISILKIYIGGNEADIQSQAMNVNLIELTYLNNLFTEFDVDLYWYAFLNAFGKLEMDIDTAKTICDWKKAFKLVDEYGMVEYTGSIDNVSRLVEIPVIEIKASDTDLIDVLKWLNNTYAENVSSGKVDVNLSYSSGKSELSDINLNDFANTKFTIEVQGSSTKGYKCKNLELGIETTEDNQIALFSPNFSTTDKSTFLPEKSFTLKADVVDSSHSNNVSVGKFINENTEKFFTGGASTGYMTYIKNCLDGFPVLIFLKVTSKLGESKTYYLGIYNFNLGRGSLSNLGYVDVNAVFNNKILANNAGAFTVMTTPASTYTINPDFAVAEILGGSPYFDFSQYDLTVLFKLGGTDSKDTTYMFGDIESGNTTDCKNWILLFTRRTALAGGHIFEEVLKKNLSEDESDNYGYSYGYSSEVCTNQVPNYKHKFTKNSASLIIPTSETLNSASRSDAVTYVLGDTDKGVLPYVNYLSLIEYYTICMALGLVDSVQKNLNIKTWNAGNTFYIAFYDMDTSLGVDNAGLAISYFSFSDYWKLDNELLEDDIIKLNLIIVYRDFFDKSAGYTGYDIPSSYLFAVAKYAKLLKLNDEDVSIMNLECPADLWAKWRLSNGSLRNASNFVENYFIGKLHSVNEVLFNLNYRYKYIKPVGNDYLASFNSDEAKRFHGRRINNVTDWLENRFHILDAYFNLEEAPVPILVYKDGVWSDLSITEPIANTANIDNLNKDIIILNDIFSSDGNKLYSDRNIDVNIRVNLLSPLILQFPNSLERYIYDSDKTYKLQTKTTGNLRLIFGGSYNFTYVDTFNPFIASNELYVNSPYLTEITADSGQLSNGITLTTPSLEKLSLNGSTFTCELNLDNSNEKGSPYSNLKELDISNSNLKLVANELSLDKLIISGGTSSTRDIELTNTTANQIAFSRVTALKLTVSPLWNNANFEGNTIKQYDLTGQNSSVSIKDSTTENIRLLAFLTVNISDCTKLTKITIADPSNLTTLKVNNCPKLTTIEFLAEPAKLKTLNLANNVTLVNIILPNKKLPDGLILLDLSQSHVASLDDSDIFDLSNITSNFSTSDSSYVSFYKNTSVKYIQFRNTDTPVILSKSFLECSSLKRIYGNISLQGASFKDCTNFSVHGDDITTVTYNGVPVYNNGITLHPSENILIYNEGAYVRLEGSLVTNLNFSNIAYSYTFSGTSCTQFDVYYVLYALKDVSNSISWMFSYIKNENKLFTFNDSPHRKTFENCGKVTDISGLFYSSCNNDFRIFSPEIEDGTFKNNGLFSPLLNCTSINTMFFSSKFFIDRNIFRLNGDTKFKLVSFSYFYGRLVSDVTALESPSITDNISLDPSNVNYFLNHGNLEGFFNNLDVSSTEFEAFLNGTYLINYDTLSDIPWKRFLGSFTSEYAVGTINMDSLFRNKNSVIDIGGCFYSGSSVNSIFEDIEDAKINWNDDTFNGFTSLKNIGLSTNSHLSRGSSIPGNDLRSPSLDRYWTFGGKINKVIPVNFPYNILLPIAKNITLADGLFRGVQVTGVVEIPYIDSDNSLFKGCSNLTLTVGAFKDFGGSIKLNGKGFKDCLKLEDISYMFSNARISGCIPSNLFYHGGLSYNYSVTGITNTDEDPTALDENGELIGSENIETFYITVTGVNTNILYMDYCFYGINPSEAYFNESPTVEINPNYKPCTYEKLLNGKWVKVTQNTAKYTDIWEYDGVHHNPQNLEILDDNTPFADHTNYPILPLKLVGSNSETDAFSDTYFCPPDLLRYCNSNCTITYLFADSGGSYSTGSYNNHHNDLNFGIKGRICPYLLKPVSAITSIKGMFKNCKLLSPLVMSESTNLAIPKDFFKYAPSINNLTDAFNGICIYEGVDLSQVFAPLSNNSLILDGTFRLCYYFSKASSPGNVSIDSVFTSLKRSITSAKNTFANNPTNNVVNSQSLALKTNLPVVFSSVFKDGTISVGNGLYIFDGYSKDGVPQRFANTCGVDTNSTYNNFRYSDGTRAF